MNFFDLLIKLLPLILKLFGDKPENTGQALPAQEVLSVVRNMSQSCAVQLAEEAERILGIEQTTEQVNQLLVILIREQAKHLTEKQNALIVAAYEAHQEAQQ